MPVIQGKEGCLSAGCTVVCMNHESAACNEYFDIEKCLGSLSSNRALVVAFFWLRGLAHELRHPGHNVFVDVLKK